MPDLSQIQYPGAAPILGLERGFGNKSSDAALAEASDETLSMLGRLVEMLEATGPLKVGFEDLSGVSYDAPELMLPKRFRIHRCSTCMAAKATLDGWNHCIRNKRATNRLATRRAAGFVGQCHFGLTEIVEPLLYDGQCLGVFYYGQVRVVDTADVAGEQSRRQRFMNRHWLPAERYEAALAATPTVSSADLPAHRERLRTVVAACVMVLRASGIPTARYATERAADRVHRTDPLPSLLNNAVRAMMEGYAQSLKAADLAEALGCHPDHLGRLFKQHFRVSVPIYLRLIRMVHARRLLRTGRFSVAEVADAVGYRQVSQFCHAFRAVVGMSPGLYAKRPPVDDERLLLPPDLPSSLLPLPSRFPVVNAPGLESER